MVLQEKKHDENWETNKRELIKNGQKRSCHKIFACKTCDYKSKWKHNLANHEKRHHVPSYNENTSDIVQNNNKLICPKCEIEFIYDSDLEMHILCCTAGPKTKELPQTHDKPIEENNPQQDELFECQICFKPFQQLDQLIKHDEEHTDINIFKESNSLNQSIEDVIVIE